jgi:hypothetical protein
VNKTELRLATGQRAVYGGVYQMLAPNCGLFLALVCISFWISLRFNRQCSTSAEQTHHVNCGDDLL